MNTKNIINNYLYYLESYNYPQQIIERREMTLQRFQRTFGEPTAENILDFIEDNCFLRHKTYTLLKCDLLSLLHFMLNGDCEESKLFREIDKGIFGM
ncbi:MAG: hypothetical protein KDD94_04380 [Calditrichaeota bacterium]|nr:hypothetical protein [Calditrichota bacterium]